MLYSRKAERIMPSLTLSIQAKAKKLKDEGIDVIGLGAGEPDFNTPLNIQESAINAMKSGFTKYTPASGIAELKSAICNKFYNENGLTYDNSQIIISTGAKQSLSNIFQAILNPGDEVLIPVPYWVSYPELVQMHDGVPILVKTTKDIEFKYTLDSLNQKVSCKTKAIIVNSPNNPTGAIYSIDELRSIANFAKEHDLIIISDEIYEKLIYDNNRHVSIASLSQDAYERTIIVNGMSKTYSMTGWRIGYAAGNKTVVKLMSSIQSHTTANPTSIAQYAALEALTGDQNTVYAMIKEFEKRRNYMVQRINTIPKLSCLMPSGAFYVMMNISQLLNGKMKGKQIKGSLDFAELLLDEESVAVIPGIAFGLDDYIRLSYATSLDKIQRGLDRIEDFLSKIVL
jgi:aspartate aminotransferase